MSGTTGRGQKGCRPMLSQENPTRTAELEALRLAWGPEGSTRRVHEIPVVMRAGPADPSVISLAYGAPSPDLFPAAGLQESAREALSSPADWAVALQYGQVLGNPVLL